MSVNGNWRPLGLLCKGDFYLRNGVVYSRPKIKPINGKMYLILSASLKIPVRITLELSADEGNEYTKRGSFGYLFPKEVR